MSNNANILSLPFRRSTQISLVSVIRQYINTKYDQHPDMFKNDLEVIDNLRRDAVNVREPHSMGIKKLQAYAAQLVWIGGKFPIDIDAEFTWYPALGYNTERPMVRNNLKYELMNILYNLASLYSQLALNTPRGNTDGLKTAANYFSLAAGVLSHMQTAILPELRMSDPPEDMDHATLESLTQLLLAQSQECFWQKAVMDGYKDASIAKLAARVSDLYNSAGEAAMQSEAISTAWIQHMTAKHHHFAAAAQYRAACDCLEKKKYGEEVARLMDAVSCVTDGLKEAKKGYLNKTVVDDMLGLKSKVTEDLKRAEKDNDMIFLSAVPSKSDLKKLERANMAIARIPPQVSNPYDCLGDTAEFGPALFSRLVPFSVHVAISIYEERRDRMVNQNIIQELETLTAKIHSRLSSMGLPGSLQALEKPLGLPPSLLQHAEEVRQADGVNKIQKSFGDIDRLRENDLATFEDGKAALSAEEAEDQQLRSKYGTERWTRPESQADAQGHKLWHHGKEIEGYFQSSISSDGIVRDKFASIEELLGLLSGSDRDLLRYIPSGRTLDTSDDLKQAVGRVRSAYNDALRAESRRRKKMEAVREASRKDDIKPAILKETARLERTFPNTAIVPAHFEDFFEKRLNTLYEPEIQRVEADEQEQEQVMTQVERANREFEAQRRHAGDKGTKERERALQKLDDAYYKYKEIVNNLEVGRKFYNDLNKIVGQGFKDVVKGWVAQRRMEARAFEEELSMPPLSNLNLARDQQPVQSPAPSSYQAQQAASSPHQPRQTRQQTHHSTRSQASPQVPQQQAYQQQQPHPVQAYQQSPSPYQQPPTSYQQPPTSYQSSTQPQQAAFQQQSSYSHSQNQQNHQGYGQAAQSPAAAASIQSWGSPPPARASSNSMSGMSPGSVQQPQPRAPQANMGGGPVGDGAMWNPNMGIKFGGSTGTGQQGGQQQQQQQQGQQRGGTWQPNSGIKFG